MSQSRCNPLIWYWFISETFSHVSWWEFMLDLNSIWVQLKILLSDSLQQCLRKQLKKIPPKTFLRTPSSWERLRRDFFGHLPTEYLTTSTYLTTSSCQIWDFLLSCWGCLRILRLEICLLNDKFVFSEDDR